LDQHLLGENARFNIFFKTVAPTFFGNHKKSTIFFLSPSPAGGGATADPMAAARTGSTSGVEQVGAVGETMI
jgi:hypothetical protein